MKRLLFVCVVALVGSLVTLAACKQGEGGRCQVRDDCESPLVCNEATGTCQTTAGMSFDAGTIDMVPADVPSDSTADAMPDT